MWLEVSYILYNTSYHEQTGDIITFEKFEEGNLVENEYNAEEDKSISASIEESSTYNFSDEVYISKNTFKEIWDRRKKHTEINAGDNRLKIRDSIKQTINEWKKQNYQRKL